MLLHCDIVHGRDGTLAPVHPAGRRAGSRVELPPAARRGPSRGRRTPLHGRLDRCATGVELGIASRVYAPADLLPAARAIAARIAAGPIGAIRHTKRLVLATRADQVRAAREREDRAFEERIGTPENLEAITAFFAKRPPDFSKFPRLP
jgi:enoyl-CoA hydratase/carnithine racemase